MKKEELAKVLELHAKWLAGDDSGERANLSRADLSYANLSGASLFRADLSGANLFYADLSYAYLSGASLSGANLSGANLCRADLSGADLSGAYLSGANLSGVKGSELAQAITVITPQGTIIGWKKCTDNIIVKLQIPAKAKRSNASGRKCRAEYAKVLDVIGGEVGVSMTAENKLTYKKGETVQCDKWDEDRWNECSGGIHFFLTKEEAEEWS